MDEVVTMREIATSSSATTGPSSPLPLTTNLPLLSAFLAFSVAQFLKIFTTWFKEKRWDSRRLLGSGGMPSSHSATVVALATAIGFQEGTAGSSFALAIVLASVVMYDASGIRLHAGRQAEVIKFVHNALFLIISSSPVELTQPLKSWTGGQLLNQILYELPPEHPLSTIRPLRELLGHTPLQVIAGAILGFIVSYLLRNS